ncbi:MAG: hypothetical protein GY760_09600 [Deltaproteobacteria bacterium]|nr:hypothetical protein [Deltaproteobacteria bacterium]
MKYSLNNIKKYLPFIKMRSLVIFIVPIIIINIILYSCSNSMYFPNIFKMNYNDGYSSLCEAIINNDYKKVKKLLVWSSINSYCGSGQTPLHYAAEARDKRIAQLLIIEGAKVNAKTDLNKSTPLHLAVLRCNKEVVKILIKNGADVNYSDKFIGTPLHYAVKAGTSIEDPCENRRIIELLSQNGADMNRKNRDGFTPLNKSIKSISFNPYKTIMNLLDFGANPLVMDNNQYSSLHYASYFNSETIMEMLLKHCKNVNIKGPEGITALHLSSDQGNDRMISLLINYGALTSIKNNYGVTPLQGAAYHGHFKAVQVLLLNKANVNTLDNNKSSSLHWAVFTNKIKKPENRIKIVRLLIEYGAKKNLKNSNLTTPLHYAAVNGYNKVVHHLIQKKAHINSKDKDGRTPLIGAISTNKIATAKLIINMGASLKMKDNMNNTALHFAANFTNDVGLVNLLINRGVPINKKNKNGSTALHFAVQNNLKITKYLIKKGADINALDIDMKTPLQHASGLGKKNIIKFLKLKGAR